MKQAGRWLLLSAAIVLVPAVSLAQKKKPTGGGAGAAASSAAPVDVDNPGGAATGAATGAAGGNAPGTGPAVAPAGADTGQGVGTETDICKITPDAPQCVGAAGGQPLDLQTAAKKEVSNREIYAVTQI